MQPRFFTVDVFAERPYSGNPLAVVLDADRFDADSMQRIAAEINYSETTFVMSAPERGGGWRVRMFTPAREMTFGGHPILGTAWVIRRHLERNADGPVRLNVPVGQVRVDFEPTAAGEVAWFTAPPVRLGATCPAQPIAAALGITAADIDTRAPVQQYVAGVAALIVPLRGLDALCRARLDLAAFAPLAAAGFEPLVYLFCTETRRAGNDLAARFFFEAHGVREDPATGNAAAFLGHHLLEHRFFDRASLSLRIEQGDEIGRLSLVLLRARSDGAARAIGVGGSVVPIVEGKLLG
ncbi:MAG: phenazine biosynthesis protein [Betaproteobacteria bacterium]|nr:MAG: phenazine biosynthesis protein [Betaproteobacteria bacterium]